LKEIRAATGEGVCTYSYAGIIRIRFKGSLIALQLRLRPWPPLRFCGCDYSRNMHLHISK
jgi:hypothetical protein